MHQTRKGEIMLPRFLTACSACLCVVLIISGASAMANAPDMPLYDFTSPEQLQPWMVINDGVMGGISRSTFITRESVGAVFAGVVSLENFGGFCSASSRPGTAVDAGGFTGIAIRCKGDGKTYKATLKNDASFGGFAYQRPFIAPAGEWVVIKAPFDEFQAYFRGQKVGDAPPLDRGNLQSFGILIADKQAGPFELRIEWIRAYR
jgi:monofunctional biosynthetic peptidoglycan transglycosylase